MQNLRKRYVGKVWSKPGSDFQRVSQRLYQYLIPQATNCSNLHGWLCRHLLCGTY